MEKNHEVARRFPNTLGDYIKLKKLILLLLVVLSSFAIAGLSISNRIRSQVNDLFRMNEILQSDGYYMADFEFKMMGILYYLDKGRYSKALSTLSEFHFQLMHKENLIRVPEFKSAEEEMNFYLNLQNPRTGAFMDDSFPYCTFNEPTENIILHLDALAKSLGIPLQLKYPLTYLDEINTPEKLSAFLDDVAYVGWIGSRFPETTFIFARSLLSYWNDEGLIGQNKLYRFSDDCRTALLGWFYANQDSATGYWGPKSQHTGRLRKIDLNNTASIIKAFVDKNGNNIHELFPLRYKYKIFETTIDLLKESPPADNDLDEWHAWNLSRSKGINMLLRYLWEDASDEHRQNVKQIIADYVKIKFEKFYVPDEGAFRYYPNAEHASLDGTGGFIFTELGAYSHKRQDVLWGDVDTNIKDLGQFKISGFAKGDLDLITDTPDVNSLRIYYTMPSDTSLTDDVIAVVYPHDTPVLDAVELVFRVRTWLDSVPFSMGNWTSREQVKAEYFSFKMREPIVYRETVPLGDMNQILQEKKELHIIGFDILQIPRYRIAYSYLTG